MSNYFDGAVMAYRDCAEFIKHIQENLPQEIKAFGPTLETLHDTFMNKANNVILLVNRIPDIRK